MRRWKEEARRAVESAVETSVSITKAEFQAAIADLKTSNKVGKNTGSSDATSENVSISTTTKKRDAKIVNVDQYGWVPVESKSKLGLPFLSLFHRQR